MAKADADAVAADDTPLQASPEWEAWLSQRQNEWAHFLAEEFGDGLGMARAADRKHCETLIAKTDEHIAKLEGKIDAMMAVLALTKDRLGDLRGEKGERGARGLTGRKGRDGKDAPTWSGLSFDPQTLSFVAEMSDGSIGPLISLARLFAGIEIDAKNYSVVLRTIGGDELKLSLHSLFQQYDNEKSGTAQ